MGDELTYVLRLGTNMDSLSLSTMGVYGRLFTGTDDIVTDNIIYYWSVTAVDRVVRQLIIQEDFTVLL